MREKTSPPEAIQNRTNTEHTQEDFKRRVATGAWPSSVRHGLRERFYDYDLVVVTWRGNEVITYRIGEGRTGYGDDSAFAQANLILSAHAREVLMKAGP